MRASSFALALIALVVLARPVAAEDDRARARQLFESGLALARENRWDAALASFLRSREIFATKGNTQNAAVALSRVGRYDEAYDTFAALLKEFPDLDEAARKEVEAELGKLVRLVGAIELVSTDVGARVTVDGRVRGAIPLSGSVRVTAGTHLLRVFKEGFVSYSEQVDVAGGETVSRRVKLQALRRSGVLGVVEATGKRASVFVDGALVGTTPWQGRLDPGQHGVALRGDGMLGTQPVSAKVSEDRAVTLSLALEPLACKLTVSPTPVGASVAIDGIEVGRGVWSGPLRCGPHRVEIVEEGFVGIRRDLRLTEDRAESLLINLERDPQAARWRLTKPPRFELGVSVGPALGLTLGGERSEGCGDGCQRGLAFGALGFARPSYVFSSGLGLGLEVGALRVTQTVDGARVGVEDGSNGGPLLATVHDEARLDALLFGANASLTRGDDWAWRTQLSLGVAFAEVDAFREGTLLGGEPMKPTRDTSAGRFFYAAPELGVLRRLGAHWEIGAMLRGLVLVALARPTFDDERAVTTASGTPTRFVRYDDVHTGRVVFLLSPELYASYSFF
jgi:hypothetical protein